MGTLKTPRAVAGLLGPFSAKRQKRPKTPWHGSCRCAALMAPMHFVHTWGLLAQSGKTPPWTSLAWDRLEYPTSL
jgi:hypothetical protein